MVRLTEREQAVDRLVRERREAARGVGDLTDGRMEALLEGAEASGEEIRTMIWWLRQLRDQVETLEGRVSEVRDWKARMRPALIELVDATVASWRDSGVEPPARVRVSAEAFRRVLQDEERREG